MTRQGKPTLAGLFVTESRHGLTHLSQYDQIERDIGPWLGIEPAEFRRRVDKLENEKFS
jgi:hypothetical protein